MFDCSDNFLINSRKANWDAQNRYIRPDIQLTNFEMSSFPQHGIIKDRISKIDAAFVNKAVYFSVKSAPSDEGELVVSVTSNGSIVPSSIMKENNGDYLVHFTPQHAQTHLIAVTLNGKHVSGSPLDCEI